MAAILRTIKHIIMLLNRTASVQVYLDSLEDIWLDTNEVPLDVKGLIKFLLEQKAGGVKTLHSVNGVPTVYGAWGNRTIEDIYRIVKHYIKETKLVEVYDALFSLLCDTAYSFVCKNIMKRVYGIDTGPYGKRIGIRYVGPDEFGVNIEGLVERYNVKLYGGFTESVGEYFYVATPVKID